MRFILGIFKFIFKTIFLILFSIIITVALIYRSVTPPESSDPGVFDIDSTIEQQLLNVIDPNTTNKEVGIYISQDTINATIEEALVSSFSSYLSDEDEYMFILSENVKIQGVWVELKENKISLNIGAHLMYDTFIYKTRFLVELKVLGINNNNFQIKILRVNLGNLPFRWLLRVTPEITKHIDFIDINSMLDEVFNDIGEYDYRKQIISISANTILDNLSESASELDSIKSLMNIEGLLDIGVSLVDDKYHFKAVINMNKLEDTSDIYKLPSDSILNSENELNTLLESKAIASIFSQQFQLDTNELNSILNLILEIDEDSYLASNNIYKDFELRIGNPYFELNNDAIMCLPLQFGKDGNYFKSIIKINVQFVIYSKHLKINFNEVKIGAITLEEDIVKGIFDMFESDTFVIEDMSFVIEDFFDLFSDQPVNISEIYVKNKKLVMKLQTPSTHDLFDKIAEQLPDFENISNEIFDRILNEEEITEEEIDLLLDIYDNLTEEEKDSLLEIAGEYFDIGQYITP